MSAVSCVLQATSDLTLLVYCHQVSLACFIIQFGSAAVPPQWDWEAYWGQGITDLPDHCRFLADPAAKKELQTKELNNGRLAMIAIAAFVVSFQSRNR